MGKFREWVNNNSAVVTITAVVVLLVALFVIIRTNRPGRGPRITEIYFFDVNSGKLITDKPERIPPFDTDSGKDAAVRAHVFGCGDCSEANRFIAYLDRYNAEGKRRMEARANTPPDQMSESEYYEDDTMWLEVRAAQGGPWFPQLSEPGQRVTSLPPNACPQGVRLVACFPGMK